MTNCPVCGREIDEAAARTETGQTAHGAAEVDPTRGPEASTLANGITSTRWFVAASLWPGPRRI